MKNKIFPSLVILFTLIFYKTAFAIVGGAFFPAEPYRFSAIVGMQIVYGSKMDICTGTLLNPTTVLTAAHCFDNMNSATITLFKSIDMNRDRSAQMRISPSQIFIHPNYFASKKVSSDFAIIKLNQIFYGSEYIPYPTLLADNSSNHFGLYGYGFDENNQHSVLKLVFKTKEDLVPTLGNEFISLNQKSGGGICSGDSGGPLIVSYDGKLYIVAINDSVVAFNGRACYGTGVFSKIEPVIDWIKSYL